MIVICKIVLFSFFNLFRFFLMSFLSLSSCKFCMLLTVLSFIWWWLLIVDCLFLNSLVSNLQLKKCEYKETFQCKWLFSILAFEVENQQLPISSHFFVRNFLFKFKEGANFGRCYVGIRIYSLQKKTAFKGLI